MAERKLTQQALASAIGVSRQAVGKWLNGARPRGEDVYKLAEVFGVPVEILLKSEATGLTQSSDYGTIASMRFEMAKLLDQVRSLTAPRNRRAELARSLGVSDSRISEWLSGKSEPDGQNTLKLLNWVREQGG